jgi:hypothetical protein
MQEVELTAHRLLSVWWLKVWRGTLGGILVGVVAGGLAGFAVALGGHPELGATAGGFAGIALMPFWWLLIVHMGLNKKYEVFGLLWIRRRDAVRP